MPGYNYSRSVPQGETNGKMFNLFWAAAKCQKGFPAEIKNDKI